MKAGCGRGVPGLRSTTLAISVLFVLPILFSLATSADDSVPSSSPSARELLGLDASPSVRSFHDMAYDTESDRTILFGGGISDFTNYDDTWAYELNGNVWVHRNPAIAPRERCCFGMAYDADSDVIVLFGGGDDTEEIELNETWIYDYNTDAWTEMTPAADPGPRAGHRMAYDAESDRIILYGGHLKGSPPSQDTWAYDFDSNTWSEMAPATHPATIDYYSLAYDDESDRVVLFGGRVDQSDNTNDETWAYDYNSDTWTQMNANPRPAQRWFHAMAYDGQSDRVILFGGTTGSGVAGPSSNETWAYDFNVDSWTNLEPASAPSVRASPGLAYDLESDRMVLFGGAVSAVGVSNNETWAYDYNSNTWDPLTLPSAPLNLQASAGDGQVVLAWASPASTGGPPVESYKTYRGGTAGGASFLVDAGNVLTYTDTGVTNGLTYYYRVSAVTAAGEGPLSSERSATPMDTTDPVVTITSPVDGATVSFASVEVQGTASDNNAIERVEVSTDGANWTLATGTEAWSATVILDGGVNTVHARVRDVAGNVATESVMVTLRTTDRPRGVDPMVLALSAAIAVAAGAAVALLAYRKRRGRRNT